MKVRKIRWYNKSSKRRPGYALWHGQVGKKIVCSLMEDGRGRWIRRMECFRYFGKDREEVRNAFGTHKSFWGARVACEKQWEQFILGCIK